MGVIVGGRVREDLEVLVFVRCVATALVAGVIAQLILYPNRSLLTPDVAACWISSGRVYRLSHCWKAPARGHSGCRSTVGSRFAKLIKAILIKGLREFSQHLLKASRHLPFSRYVA